MEDIWKNLNDRVNYHILNRILHKRDLPTAQGLNNTFDKLQEQSRIRAEVGRNYNDLKIDLKEIVLYRDKYLRFFDLIDSDKQNIESEIRNLLQNFDSSNCTLGINFPLNDSDAVIAQCSINAPELIRVASTNGGLCLIYCTVREIRTRENLRSRFDGLSNVNFIEDYTSVIGEKVTRSQYFDIINLDLRRNILEIRIDNKNEGMTKTFLEESYLQILREAIALFSHLVSFNFNSGSHNFYSMLFPLYDDSSQGKVKEMAFITDSDSLKHENTNRINSDDLRLDNYHEGGKREVGSIDFYRLGVSWDVDGPCKNVIGLSILGKQHMLSNNGGAYINSCYINSCHVASEYNFILDIIQDYA